MGIYMFSVPGFNFLPPMALAEGGWHNIVHYNFNLPSALILRMYLLLWLDLFILCFLFHLYMHFHNLHCKCSCYLWQALLAGAYMYTLTLRSALMPSMCNVG